MAATAHAEACKRSYAKHRDQRRKEAREAAAAKRVTMTPEQIAAVGAARWERERGSRDLKERKRLEQAAVRREVIMAYGGACACCGTRHYPHLTLDHIEGGGTAERKARKGTGIFRELRRAGFPEGFQVLCWNCNWAKHHEGGRCSCSDDVPLREVV